MNKSVNKSTVNRLVVCSCLLLLCLAIRTTHADADDGSAPSSRSAPTTSTTRRSTTTAPTTTRRPAALPKVDGKAMLRQFVGTFKLTGRFRAAADGPWVTVSGTETGEMILNDRYVQSGSFLDFGTDKDWNLTLTGFDPESQRFRFTSMNDSDDDMFFGEGAASADGKGLDLRSLDGRFRFEVTFDEKGYHVDGFLRDPGTVEYQFSEERYDRQK